jgi:uncharacterized UPF0160 family protein
MYNLVTHSGSFHADDVFAVATVQLMFGKENVHITRTRDESLILPADIVVDVGGVYDVEKRRFDHHQADAPVRELGLPYAAFGLVWKEFGSQICNNGVVADQIEKTIVHAVDAGDNGLALYDLRDREALPYELYQVIGSFAPPWGSQGSKDTAFLQAVDFARELLLRIIAQKQAEQQMFDLIESVYQNTSDKRVLIFDVPVSAVACIPYTEVLVIVCPDDPKSNTNWTATMVRKEFGSFASRINFPSEWTGLRNDALAIETGIADAVFCHKAGFLFVAGSKEGVLEAVSKIIT